MIMKADLAVAGDRVLYDDRYLEVRARLSCGDGILLSLTLDGETEEARWHLKRDQLTAIQKRLE